MLQLRIGQFVGKVVTVVNVGLTFGKFGSNFGMAKDKAVANRGSSICLREERALKRTKMVAKLAILAKGSAAAKIANRVYSWAS